MERAIGHLRHLLAQLVFRSHCVFHPGHRSTVEVGYLPVGAEVYHTFGQFLLQIHIQAKVHTLTCSVAPHLVSLSCWAIAMSRANGTGLGNTSTPLGMPPRT